MASKKKLRKQLRAKEKLAKTPQKRDEIGEEIDALDFEIALQDIKKWDNKRSKPATKKSSKSDNNGKTPAYKNDHAEFDEFGVILFRMNANDIFISLPDPGLNQSFVIEKSEDENYAELITDTVFKAAVNAVREKRKYHQNLKEEKKLFSKIEKTVFPSCLLEKALPASCYHDDNMVVGLHDIDQRPLDLELPAYSFVSINLQDVYHQADKTLSPMQYKQSVFPVEKSKDNNKKDKDVFFKREVDALVSQIQKRSADALLRPDVA